MTTRRRIPDLFTALGVVGVLLAGWCCTVFAVVTTSVPAEYGGNVDDAPADHLSSFGVSTAVVVQLATALIVAALLARRSGTTRAAWLRTGTVAALMTAAMLAMPSALRNFIDLTLQSQSRRNNFSEVTGEWWLIVLWLAVLALVFFVVAAPQIGAPAAGVAAAGTVVLGTIIGVVLSQGLMGDALTVTDSHEVVVHLGSVLALPAILALAAVGGAAIVWLWRSNQRD